MSTASSTSRTTTVAVISSMVVECGVVECVGCLLEDGQFQLTGREPLELDGPAWNVLHNA